MAAMGFNPAAVARMRARAAEARRDDGLAVHPDNVAAVRLLLALQTQWRTVGLTTMERAMIRRTGLDYAVVRPTAKLIGVKTDADTFARLRVLEAEAMAAWAEEASR